MDLNDFSKEIVNISINVERNIHHTLRKAALAIDQTIVMATPVDTGRARANWTVTLNVAAKTSNNRTDYEKVLDESKAVINQFGGSDTAIYISNNLAYIGRLNEGWSAQAPAGFVSSAIDSGLSVIDGASII